MQGKVEAGLMLSPGSSRCDPGPEYTDGCSRANPAALTDDFASILSFI